MSQNLGKEILDRFSCEIVPALTIELSDILKLEGQGVRQSPIVINSLLGRAIAGLLLIADKTSIEEVNEIDSDLSLTAIFLTVVSLNEVLPLDYPFIIVAVECEEDRQWRFILLKRDKIPGMHDNLSTTLLPVLRVRKFEDLYAEDFAISNVRYESGLDDLPDIFKN